MRGIKQACITDYLVLFLKFRFSDSSSSVDVQQMKKQKAASVDTNDEGEICESSFIIKPNKRCKSLWKNVELHSVVISIDTKMFFFLLERA